MRDKDYHKIRDMIIDRVSAAKTLLRKEMDEKLEINNRVELNKYLLGYVQADIKTLLLALIDYLGLDINQIQKETKLVIKPKKKRRTKCQKKKQKP